MRVNVVLRWFLGGTAACSVTVVALLLPSLATEGLAPSSTALVLPPVVAETTVQARVRPAKPQPPKPARPRPQRPSPRAVAAPRRPAAAPPPAVPRARPKPRPKPEAENGAPEPLVFLSTRAWPSLYTPPARGRVVDVDEAEQVSERRD